MKRILIILSTFAAGCACAAEAEAVAAPPPGAGGMTDMTFSELFKQGGGLMYPIAALSVLALAQLIYLMVVMRREQ